MLLCMKLHQHLTREKELRRAGRHVCTSRGRVQQFVVASSECALRYRQYWRKCGDVEAIHNLCVTTCAFRRAKPLQSLPLFLVREAQRQRLTGSRHVPPLLGVSNPHSLHQLQRSLWPMSKLVQWRASSALACSSGNCFLSRLFRKGSLPGEKAPQQHRE